jgi:hypothetical protein
MICAFISCVDNIKTAEKIKKTLLVSVFEPSILSKLIDI